MAEKRSARLKIVLQLAQKAQQDIADLMSQQQQKMATEQTQLQQLQDYSLEYQQQVVGQTQHLNSQDLINSRTFLQRLTTLQVNQEQKIHQITAVIEQLTKEWQKRYHRRQSIEDLIARLKVEESADLEKQLQNMIDEMSGQRFFQNNKEL